MNTTYLPILKANVSAKIDQLQNEAEILHRKRGKKPEADEYIRRQLNSIEETRGLLLEFITMIDSLPANFQHHYLKGLDAGRREKTPKPYRTPEEIRTDSINNARNTWPNLY